MNWLPDDYANTGGAQPAPGGATSGAGKPDDGTAGGGTAGDGREGSPSGGPPRRGGLPDVSTAAFLAGIVAIVGGPLLMADGVARYVVLAAAIAALVLGAIGVWTSLKRPGRLDYAGAALITGGVSLYLWIRYVSDPPQGGT